MDRFVIQRGNFSEEDILQIVAIHRKEISQSFLSSLGEKVLKPIFWLAAEGNSGALIVAKDSMLQTQVCGFVLGTVNTRLFYKDFLLKGPLAAFFFIAPKLFSPGNLRKGFETLLYPTKKEMKDMPKAELLDIAVSKNYQGSGLSQLLFQQFSNRLSEMGVKEFRITTGQSLLQAQRFYESLGAKRIGSIEIHRGQKTVVFVYSIA